MHHRLQGLVYRGVQQLTRLVNTGRDTCRRLWQAHLTRLEASPVYEAILLAGMELVLGKHLDVHHAITRLTTRLRRHRPDYPDPDGWAY